MIFVLYNSNNNHKIISKHRRVWVEQKTQIYLLVGEQLVLAFQGEEMGEGIRVYGMEVKRGLPMLNRSMYI